MTAINVDIGKFGTDTASSEKVILTARPDMRIVNVSFLVPVLVLVGGVIAYLLPLAVDRDFQLVGSFFITGMGLVGMTCLLVLYEGLSKAV